ncbi:hypothetical protein [Mucilaginibacter sp.]
MDKIFISNQIKLEILKVCGHPTIRPYNLPGSLRLHDLNCYHKTDFCRILEQRLQDIASHYQTGKIILPGDVSQQNTVSECIKLVFAN